MFLTVHVLNTIIVLYKLYVAIVILYISLCCSVYGVYIGFPSNPQILTLTGQDMFVMYPASRDHSLRAVNKSDSFNPQLQV